MKFASCVCQCLTTLLGDFMIRFQFWITCGMIQWSNDPPWSSLISICCGGFEPAPRTGSLAHPSLRHDAVGVRRLLLGPANSDGPSWSSRNPSNTCRWYMVKPCFTSGFTMIIYDYDSWCFIYIWMNYNEITRVMLSKGNYPQMSWFQLFSDELMIKF